MSVAVRPTCCRSPISMFQNHQHKRTRPITIPERMTLHVFFKTPSTQLKLLRKRITSRFSNCGLCCAARSGHARKQTIIRAHQHTSDSSKVRQQYQEILKPLPSTENYVVQVHDSSWDILSAFRVSSRHLRTPLGSRVQPCMFAAWQGMGEFADGFLRLIDVDLPRYVFLCSENSVW